MKLGALLSRHRRLLTAACAAAGVAFALSALRPSAPSGVRVPTAARDLPSGTTLRPSDVRPVTLPSSAVPEGLVRSGAAGRILAGPMRKGEPLTDARLVGRELLSGYGPELVAVPVRMADAESVRLLHPGDRIDVLMAFSEAAEERASSARPIASSVPVVAIPHSSPNDREGFGGAGPGEGALVVVAARRDQAAALAGSTHDSSWSFVIVN